MGEHFAGKLVIHQSYRLTNCSRRVRLRRIAKKDSLFLEMSSVEPVMVLNVAFFPLSGFSRHVTFLRLDTKKGCDWLRLAMTNHLVSLFTKGQNGHPFTVGHL